MRGIGADSVSVARDRVRCTCVLAKWTHPKGSDTHPSMVVFPEGSRGDPIYSCQACKERGSVRDLLCDLWALTGVDHYPWIEILDNDTVDVSEAAKRTRKERAQKLVERANGNFVSRPDYAKKALSKEAGRDFTPQQGASAFYDYVAANKSDEMPEIPWEAYAKHAGSVPPYAIQRGLTIETCKEWELGHDRRMRRLLFPMRDRRGRLVAISGRLYECRRCGLTPPDTVSPNVCTACGHVVWGEHPKGDPCPICNHGEVVRKRAVCAQCHGGPEMRGAPPKYLHSKGFQRNLMLYGEDRHKVDKTDGRVYVVEGHIDTLTLWQTGYRPVVATLGSWPGPSQIEKLIRDHERVITVGDGDKAGKEFAAQVKKMVAQRIPTARKKCPPGWDPNKLLMERGIEGLREVLGDPPRRIDSTLLTR